MLGSPETSFAAAPTRPPPAARIPAHGAGGRGQSRSSIGVLVVEDDEGIRQSVAELLADEGYEVLTASNGAEALKLLRSTSAPDVILLDLMMPVMDGWRFRVEQKRDPLLAHIPVIAMSASGTSQAEAIDATAFAPKPLHLDELIGNIERVVSVARAAQMEHTDRLAALGTLTAGVAHEISNPLTYVIADLDRLVTELPVALQGKYAHLPALASEALEGTRRITEIVRNIQNISHLARDQTTRAVDLRDCVARSVKLVQHEVRQRADLRLALDPVPPVRANSGRLEQVVINLLMNAVHAVDTGPGQKHVIGVATLAVPSGRVRCEITDTGSGVPAHLTGRIFEPFFTTRPLGSGTGLGLSICRSIIRDAGGEIGVMPAPDGGALFWFELPSASPDDPADHGTASAAPVA